MLTGDREATDEVLQETNLALWEQADRFEAGTNFEAWACRVAWYKVLDHRKQKRRLKLKFDDRLVELLAAEAVETAADTEAFDREKRALAACIDALAERHRMVLMLHYDKGVLLADIGATVDRNRNAVAQLLHRIRATLRAGSLLLALVASAATAAAVLLVVVSWWSARPTVPDAAVLTAGAEARFTDLRSLAPLELKLGDAVPSGPLRLESGAAQVTFGSGAVVGVNAPADLEVLSAERIFLRRGRLVPLVPPQAKGFTVVLPSGEVVDLGTEFAVTVDDQGRADVKVLDGEAAVMERRGTDAQPTRLSVGHEARLAVGEAGGQPLVTAVPLLLDGFDGVDGSDLSREIKQRQSGLFAPLAYQCLEPESPARIRGGRLQIPFEAPAGREKAKSRVVIDRDFSELQGRRWSIAFKAWLPSRKDVPQSHHLDCVIGAARDPKAMPFVWDDNARIGVLVMDDRVGIDFNGSLDPPPQPALNVFPRSADGTGPYQVLIQVDETGPGDARVDVLVNGRDLLRNFRLAMPADTGRVIGFHTWTKRDSGAKGYGEIGPDPRRRPGRRFLRRPHGQRLRSRHTRQAIRVAAAGSRRHPRGEAGRSEAGGRDCAPPRRHVFPAGHVQPAGPRYGLCRSPGHLPLVRRRAGRAHARLRRDGIHAGARQAGPARGRSPCAAARPRAAHAALPRGATGLGTAHAGPSSERRSGRSDRQWLGPRRRLDLGHARQAWRRHSQPRGRRNRRAKMDAGRRRRRACVRHARLVEQHAAGGVAGPDEPRTAVSRGRAHPILVGDRWFIEGLFEDLDAPGEWYYDKQKGSLYVRPPLEADPATFRVVAPLARSVITLGPSVQNITLQNLTFHGCEGTAVFLLEATQCTVAGCTICHVGGYHGSGVAIVGGKDNLVTGCDISHTGGPGIVLVGGRLDRREKAGHRAENNVVQRPGVICKHGAGIGLGGYGSTASRRSRSTRSVPTPTPAEQLTGRPVATAIVFVLRFGQSQHPQMRPFRSRYTFAASLVTPRAPRRPSSPVPHVLTSS